MHYSFFLTVEPSNDVDNPAIETIQLASGIIENIQIFFPIGCSGVIRCCLANDSIQLLPTNQNSYYALDGNEVNANIHYDLDANTNTLYLIAWSIGSSYNHTLTLHADVRGHDEPSLEFLQLRFIDLMDRFIDLIRSRF